MTHTHTNRHNEVAIINFIRTHKSFVYVRMMNVRIKRFYRPQRWRTKWILIAASNPDRGLQFQEMCKKNVKVAYAFENAFSPPPLSFIPLLFSHFLPITLLSLSLFLSINPSLFFSLNRLISVLVQIISIIPFHFLSLYLFLSILLFLLF